MKKDCTISKNRGEAAIAICFSEERKKVLLVRRRDMPVWVPPGGGIERDESPEESILREVEEESGYKAKIVRRVGLYTPINRLSKTTHVFECQIIGGSPETGPESRAVAFFSLDKLPKPLAPPHVEWIQDAKANSSDPIERTITCVTYWTLLRALILHPKITLCFLLSRLGIHFNNNK